MLLELQRKSEIDLSVNAKNQEDLWSTEIKFKSNMAINDLSVGHKCNLLSAGKPRIGESSSTISGMGVEVKWSRSGGTSGNGWRYSQNAQNKKKDYEKDNKRIKRVRNNLWKL